MRGNKAGKLLKVVIAVSAYAAVSAPAGTRPATAATTTAEQNRAVLVVDTGEQVKKVCVRFSEDSISGAELLRRAEVDAALRPYAGKGVAVCSLCGVGCPTDDSCLTCDPDGRYWAYSRAPSGTAAFRLSPAGASNTAVRNGDVEGWRWSRGTSPGYVSVEEVCDGAAPAAAPTATTAADSTTVPAAGEAPAVTVAPAGPSGTSVTTATSPAKRLTTPGATTGKTGSAAVSSTSSSTATTASPSAVGTDPARDTQAVAPRRAAENDQSGSPAGLLTFAALIAGLLGWAAWVRRHRAT